MGWTRPAERVLVWRDSCNVYAVEAPDGIVLVDAGTGAWLDGISDLPAPPVALLCTHCFRDHAAGAAAAARAGIPVYAPAGEADFFTSPDTWLARRETYVSYDNLWDTFVPIEPIELADVLHDYERRAIGGLEWEVVPLPGASVGQSGYLTRLPEAVCFCGEAVCAGGRVLRLAPLQYNYNDLPGAVHVYASAAELAPRRPARLFPSMGPQIGAGETDAALAGVQAAMQRLCDGRPNEAALLDAVGRDAVEPVSEHVFMSTQSQAVSWFVVSDEGAVLAIDYGYRMLQGVDWAEPWAPEWPAYDRPTNRRALLHSLDALEAATGTRGIDTVLVSHYHDDHVAGIPALQRLFGTKAWACETFAALLREPAAHKFPCNWPEPIELERVLPADGSVRWREYEFRLAPMSGHTRWSSLIGFVADGVRYAHTGDQYFLLDDGRVAQNNVYRNGAQLGDYRRSLDVLLDWRPDWLLTGHSRPLRFDESLIETFTRWADEYDDLHRQGMILGEDEPHFGLDSLAGFIWPYRSLLAGPDTVSVTATVRNPLPRECELRLRLRSARGDAGPEVVVAAAPRAEVSAPLELELTRTGRRIPIAVELTADGQPFGQVAEALVTVGGSAF